MVETGNPYAAAAMDYFGREDELRGEIEGALDLINNPERWTAYGPVAQIVFGLGAWLRLGDFLVFKMLLVGLEILGWWWLRRMLGWRGWVLGWWCPLAITEVAFTGHPEAIGVALLAGVLAGWKTRANGGKSVGTE